MFSGEFLDWLRKGQKQLAKKVVLKDVFREVKTIGGFDTAYRGSKAFSCGVILDYENLEILETKRIKTKVGFPYIPTFLSFREASAVVKVYRKLKSKPDILIVNGQGVAHPLRCGFASHLGVLLDRPTIGVAQKRLIGDYKEPGNPGEYTKLMFENEQLGWVLKSKKSCKPIFVSPGHGVSLESSLEIVIRCLKGHKLPEPLRLSHLCANEFRSSNRS